MVLMEKDLTKTERRGIKQSIPLAFAIGKTVAASWYFKLHTSKMLFDLNYYSDTLILLYLPSKAIVSVVHIEDQDYGISSES